MALILANPKRRHDQRILSRFYSLRREIIEVESFVYGEVPHIYIGMRRIIMRHLRTAIDTSIRKPPGQLTREISSSLEPISTSKTQCKIIQFGASEGKMDEKKRERLGGRIYVTRMLQSIQ